MHINLRNEAFPALCPTNSERTFPSQCFHLKQFFIAVPTMTPSGTLKPVTSNQLVAGPAQSHGCCHLSCDLSQGANKSVSEGDDSSPRPRVPVWSPHCSLLVSLITLWFSRWRWICFPSAGVQGVFGHHSDTGFEFEVVLCGARSWTQFLQVASNLGYSVIL